MSGVEMGVRVPRGEKLCPSARNWERESIGTTPSY